MELSVYWRRVAYGVVGPPIVLSAFASHAFWLLISEVNEKTTKLSVSKLLITFWFVMDKRLGKILNRISCSRNDIQNEITIKVLQPTYQYEFKEQYMGCTSGAIVLQ